MFCTISLLGITVTVSGGCVRLASNLMYVIKGNDLPAEFGDLEEKRVAVAVSTDAGFGGDAAGVLMARHVGSLLARNVKKIQLVNQEEVDRIIGDQADPARNMHMIASRVQADYIVYVDLENLRLKEGKTLYRGRCEATVSVFKANKGEGPVFTKRLPEFVYPQVGAPITDFNEAEFQRAYLTVFSTRIGRLFYPYDRGSDVAMDATILGFDKSQ